MTEQKTITLSYSQFWSVVSGVAVAVFVLTTIYASFLDVRATQSAGMEMFNEFKAQIFALDEDTNRRIDTKTGRIEKEIEDLEKRIKILESK